MAIKQWYTNYTDRLKQMKSQIRYLAVALVSLGISAVSAQGGSDLNRAQAVSALTEQARAKAEALFLERLLERPVQDALVEFVIPLSATPASADPFTRLQAVKAEFYSAKQQITAAITPADIELLRDYDALPMSFLRVKSRRALVQLLNNPNVKAVHENKAHTHSLVQSLPLIRQVQAVATGRQGVGTTVAVLDTGVDYARAAFGSCAAPGVPPGCRVVAAIDTAPADGQLDANGHGTNVAGIVAGVAPATRIAAIDVFSGPSAFVNDIVAGIDWAINNQARYNIVAMNLSLGVAGVKYVNPCPNSWASTPFANARAAGIVPVVAAGNDGFTDGVSEPACAPGAIRVGAVYDSNVGSVGYGVCSDPTTAADRVTCFSNNGNMVTMLAPGAPISAAGITQSGTSQATPHVAGAIAVLRAADAAPGDTLDQTVNRMASTGALVNDHRSGLQKPRLDLFAAVSSINVTPPPAQDLSWLIPILDSILGD